MALCTMTDCERKAAYQVRGEYSTKTWRTVKDEEGGRYCKTCADIRMQGYNRNSLELASKRKGHGTRR
jgi:predicted adenine nucleotide alpha hydrolase (AANH) superfamily ATPase